MAASESFSGFFPKRIDRRYTRVHPRDMSNYDYRAELAASSNGHARAGTAATVHATYQFLGEDNTTVLHGSVCSQIKDRTGGRFHFTSDAVTCTRCLKAMARMNSQYVSQS
jgi:hypothetical protein